MKKIFTTAALVIAAVTGANASINTDNATTSYTATQWEYYAAAEYGGGTGTADDPYIIATPEQLMKLAVEINNKGFDDNNWEDMYSAGKYWKQTADIVLNENVLANVTWADGDASSINSANLKTFYGIGYYTSDYDFCVFAGTYDGGGHTISGMYTKDGVSALGLFNYVRSGVVKNLIIKDSYIGKNANVGLVVGMAEKGSVIMNCQTSGIIYCGGSYHAGVVGTADNSKVLNCASDAWLWAKNNVGGVVGKLSNTALASNCFFSGWLGAVYSNTAKFKYWGGICSEVGNSESTVTKVDPDNADKTITVCENPSRAENSYWMDTCTVRHFPDSKVEAYSSSTSKYGVVENCSAISVDKVADLVNTLNENAKSIEGACSWELDATGKPVLKFEESGTGIVTVNAAATANSACNVYTLQGTLVRKAATQGAALNGLSSGVYVVGGKKIVVK